MWTEDRKTLDSPKPVNLARIFSPLAFFTLAVLFFYPKIFSKVYIDLGDSWSHFFGRMIFLKKWLSEGYVPIWNPQILFGMPSDLDAVSAFTYPTLLLLFLPAEVVWNLKIFISCWGGGLAMFFLLRVLRISFLPALWGSALFLGFTTAQVPDYLGFFLSPLLFAFAHFWVRSRNRIWSLALTFGVFIYFLHSNPQYVLYLALFLYLYMIAGTLQANGKRENVFGVLFQAALPFVLALGLCAFQILPVMELLSLSNRQDVVQGYRCFLFPLDMIQMLYPRFYESSQLPDLSFMLERLRGAVLSRILKSDHLLFSSPPYVGVLPFFFFCLAFLKKKKSFFEAFCLGITSFILLYMILNPLLYLVIRHVPILNLFWSADRLYAVYYLCAAALGAGVFQELLERPSLENFHGQQARRFLSFMLVFAVALAVVLTALHLFFRIFEPAILDLLKEHALPWIQGDPAFKASLEFYLERVKQLVQFLKAWTSPLNLHLSVPSILTIGSLLVLNSYAAGRLKRLPFVAFCFLLLFSDMKFHKAPSASFFPFELRPMAEEAEFLRRQEGIFRVMPLQPESDPKNPLLVDKRAGDTRLVVMRPETQNIYGLSAPQAYRSISPKQPVQFMELLTGSPSKGWMSGEYENLDEEIADLANIRYVITPREKDLRGDYSLAYESEKYKIFLNPDVLPRAFVVHQIRVAQSGEEILEAVRAKAFDFSKEAMLEAGELAPGNYPIGFPSDTDRAEITRCRPNDIEIKTQTASEGYLILTDAFYPGWKARIDGAPVPIQRTNYIFRAVRLAPGEHTVLFFYQPESWRLGAWISLITLVLLAAIHFFWRAADE